MKKRNLVVGSILLAILSIPAFGKTTITPSIEVESNTYDNVSTQKQDDVIMGVALTQTLTDKSNISLEVYSYDYDYIGDKNNTGDLTKASSKDRVIAYLYNEIYRSQKGANINLGLGIQQDNSTVATNKTISYRARPIWNYPVTKNFVITGDWLFTKDKTDKTGAIGDYYSTYELITGVKYTGIANYTLSAQLYNYAKNDIEKNNDTSEKENQIRGKISTKVAGITVAPWVRIDLGKYKYTDSTGKEKATSEKARNRYGIDLSKVVNNVNYTTSLYIQPTKYTLDGTNKDETLKYVKVAATYIF